jgi:hypothetical protein
MGFSFKLNVCFACIFLLTPLTALALNNPSSASLDSPSAADLDVSLTIPTLFRIGGISDLDFGSYTGNGSPSMNDDVCVWTNASTGEYRVTAQGSGTGFAFVVKKVGDTSRQIPYTTHWNNTSGISGNIPLDPNVTSANISGANTVSTTCASGPGATANYEVKFQAGDLQAARSGTYTGVLSLIISAGT